MILDGLFIISARLFLGSLLAVLTGIPAPGPDLAVAMTAKLWSTSVAMAPMEQAGGVPEFSAVLSIITGVLGVVAASILMTLFLSLVR